MIGYVLREENVILLVFSSGIYQLTAYMDQFQRWFEIRARWPKKLSIADIPGMGSAIAHKLHICISQFCVASAYNLQAAVEV